MSQSQEFSIFVEDIKSCNDKIRNEIILKLSRLTVLFYLIFAILCFLFVPFFIPLKNTAIANDFRIFYQSAQILLEQPEYLYSSSIYNMPFRYFPFFSLLFIPYTFIPFEITFIIHITLMAIIHIASFYIIFILSSKILKVQFDTKIKRDLLFLNLMTPLLAILLLIGQITEIFIFFILISILILENDNLNRYKLKFKDFILGFLLGLSVSFKPFAFLLIPFFLKIYISYKSRAYEFEIKETLIASCGFFLAISVNIIYWILYPNLIFDFIMINFNTQLPNYPSSSITRIIIIMLNALNIQVPEALVMLILFLCLYSFLFFFYIQQPIKQKNHSLFVGMSMLLILIIFPDSWFLNFLILFMIFIPGYLKIEEDLTFENSQGLEKKLSYTYLLNYNILKYGILYFTIGIVLGFTIIPFDPILPPLLLILYFVMLWKIYLYNIQRKEKNQEDI